MFDADFRGNIYVVQEGRVICERSSGYADLPNKIPNTLGRLLKREWYDIDPKVTVRQLLTHSSGVPDYFDESVMDDYEELWRDFPNYRIRRNADLLSLLLHKPMMYPRREVSVQQYRLCAAGHDDRGGSGRRFCLLPGVRSRCEFPCGI